MKVTQRTAEQIKVRRAEVLPGNCFVYDNTVHLAIAVDDPKGRLMSAELGSGITVSIPLHLTVLPVNAEVIWVFAKEPA